MAAILAIRPIQRLNDGDMNATQVRSKVSHEDKRPRRRLKMADIPKQSAICNRYTTAISGPDVIKACQSASAAVPSFATAAHRQAADRDSAGRGFAFLETKRGAVFVSATIMRVVMNGMLTYAGLTW